jgi:hypothetical protein
MKEFVVYTLLRIGLFLGAFAIVFGVWDLLADGVPLLGALVVAFVISGAASLVLLDKPRDAFALRVQQRAERASAAFEERRAREDRDDRP